MTEILSERRMDMDYEAPKAEVITFDEPVLARPGEPGPYASQDL